MNYAIFAYFLFFHKVLHKKIFCIGQQLCNEMAKRKFNDNPFVIALDFLINKMFYFSISSTGFIDSEFHSIQTRWIEFLMPTSIFFSSSVYHSFDTNNWNKLIEKPYVYYLFFFFRSSVFTYEHATEWSKRVYNRSSKLQRLYNFVPSNQCLLISFSFYRTIFIPIFTPFHSNGISFGQIRLTISLSLSMLKYNCQRKLPTFFIFSSSSFSSPFAVSMGFSKIFKLFKND